MIRHCFIFLCLALVCFGASAGLQDDWDAAVKAYDMDAMAALQAKFNAEADGEVNAYEAQRAVAEAYAVRAAMYRRERHIQKLPKAEDETKRDTQAEWSVVAMPYAERALALAQTDAEKAHANRLIGELYSHQITGMISGMRNGPKAKRHILAALALLPDDPECNRAIGIMYLHNPPMSGGDVDKAVSTFEECIKKRPKNDRYYILLAMAHRKKGEVAPALDVVRQARTINPKNLDAKHLIEVLQ